MVFFKYGKFLLENFIELANLAGFSYTPAKLDIIFLVGISFYTFQTISYTLDFYFKKTQRLPIVSRLWALRYFLFAAGRGADRQSQRITSAMRTT